MHSRRKASLKLGIYLIGSAYEMDFVSTTLFIPPRTIYHYLNEYHKSGKTRNDRAGGGRANYLTDEQENAVEEDLKNTVYFSTLGIAAYMRLILKKNTVEHLAVAVLQSGQTARVLGIKGLGKFRLQLMRPSNVNSFAPIMK